MFTFNGKKDAIYLQLVVFVHFLCFILISFTIFVYTYPSIEAFKLSAVQITKVE